MASSAFASGGSPITKGTLKLDELEKGIAEAMPAAEQFAKAEGSTALSGLATARDPGLRNLVSFWSMDQPARRCFVLAVLITAGHISWQEISQPKAKARALITDGDKALTVLWEEAKEATRRARPHGILIRMLPARFRPPLPHLILVPCRVRRPQGKYRWCYGTGVRSIGRQCNRLRQTTRVDTRVRTGTGWHIV